MLRASGWNLRGKWAKEQKGHLIMKVFSKARQQAMVWCIYNCLLFPHTHHKNLWLHRMDVYQWTAVGQGDPLELPHTGWDYSTKNVTLSAHPHTAEPTRWLRKTHRNRECKWAPCCQHPGHLCWQIMTQSRPRGCVFGSMGNFIFYMTRKEKIYLPQIGKVEKDQGLNFSKYVQDDFLVRMIVHPELSWVWLKSGEG